MKNSTKKLLITLAIAVAVIVLPAATCEDSDHAGIAYDTGIGTIQLGDAMDLSCAADPTSANCDAFSK